MGGFVLFFLVETCETQRVRCIALHCTADVDVWGVQDLEIEGMGKGSNPISTLLRLNIVPHSLGEQTGRPTHRAISRQ